jgi:hypothetical protein
VTPVLEIVAPATVRPGEAVPIALRVTNADDRSLDLYLVGRTPTFDIVVTAPDGEVVWRRLEGASVQQILQVRTLAPGETLELRDTWSQRTNAGAAARQGSYTVQGIIPTDGEPLRTAVVPLRVAPR